MPLAMSLICLLRIGQINVSLFCHLTVWEDVSDYIYIFYIISYKLKGWGISQVIVPYKFNLYGSYNALTFITQKYWAKCKEWFCSVAIDKFIEPCHENSIYISIFPKCTFSKILIHTIMSPKFWKGMTVGTLFQEMSDGK